MRIPPDELAVDATGFAEPQAIADLAKHTVGDGASDVLVLAHGWNETRVGATALYTRLADGVADRIARRETGDRAFAALGVVWPSLRWADADGVGVSGGGASLGDDVLQLHRAIGESVDDAATGAELRALVTGLDTAAGRAAFLETLRRRLPDAATVADDDPLPGALAHGDPEELFAAVAAAGGTAELLGGPPGDGGDPPAGPPGLFTDPLGSDGGAAVFGFGFPDLSPLLLARYLINITSYYTMKERAGLVGSGAVARLVAELHAQDPAVRVHLAGHSFGARVVAAAATASSVPVQSLTLLQGAFSHVGFAPAEAERPVGAFRPALTDGVRGPVVVTHTHNDRSVTLAYAIASRVARQVADALGGPDDPYGGIGANGAVQTPEAVFEELADRDATYAFVPGQVHNLQADRFVKHHLDIRGPEVSNALLQAMLTT
jgi:hypothetical protein